LAAELNGTAAFGTGVIDRALRDVDVEHFLKTKGLGTKLNVIVIPLLSLASLVLDRPRFREELDDICTSNEAKPVGAKPHPARDPHARGSRLNGGFMCPGMMGRTLDGETVFYPNLFQAMHGASPLAEEKIIEGSDGLVVVFRRQHDLAAQFVEFVHLVWEFDHTNSFGEVLAID
jgi:hypothetical protein